MSKLPKERGKRGILLNGVCTFRNDVQMQAESTLISVLDIRPVNREEGKAALGGKGAPQ